MSPDGVGKLLNTNAGNDLIFSSNLQKPLVEDIVFVAVDKCRDIPDDRQNVELVPLDGVVGQKDVMQLEVEEVVAHDPHHLVGLHVVHVEDVEVVETAVEGLAYLKL
jgi:hypothetical protein